MLHNQLFKSTGQVLHNATNEMLAKAEVQVDAIVAIHHLPLRKSGQVSIKAGVRDIKTPAASKCPFGNQQVHAPKTPMFSPVPTPIWPFKTKTCRFPQGSKRSSKNDKLDTAIKP